MKAIDECLLERYKAWVFEPEKYYLRTISDKRRIQLPEKYAHAIHDKTPGLDAILRSLPQRGKACIQCLDEIAFDSVRQMLTINGFLSYSRNASITQRAFYSGSQWVEIKKNGTMALPRWMFEFAGIDRFAIIIGRGNYFLISSPESFADVAAISDLEKQTRIAFPLLAHERIQGYKLLS